MSFPGTCLKVQEMVLMTVVQKLLCNIKTLVQPLSSADPTTVSILDGKFGVNERGLFRHELVDCRASAWLGVNGFVEALNKAEPTGVVVHHGGSILGLVSKPILDSLIVITHHCQQ